MDEDYDGGYGDDEFGDPDAEMDAEEGEVSPLSHRSQPTSSC